MTPNDVVVPNGIDGIVKNSKSRLLVDNYLDCGRSERLWRTLFLEQWKFLRYVLRPVTLSVLLD